MESRVKSKLNTNKFRNAGRRPTAQLVAEIENAIENAEHTDGEIWINDAFKAF